ncbi:MAG: AraC family transcriptional regulator [Oscillospiraceae bacterium]|nr:AraC family transcriptional regulator [Oscillospiraceae bacterium]
MEWIEGLNKAISYIEEHLTEEISYDELARIACCSAYHFQRMFAYMAGVPLSEYIRRRRMSLAAADLQSGEGKIIDIGMKYGYTSPTAFNRAFQSVHGMAPSMAKKGGAPMKAYPPISFKITVKGAEELNYRIEEKAAFRIVGVSHPLDKEIEKNFKTVPQMWQNAAMNGTIEKLAPLMNDQPMGVLGVSVCNDKEDWRYFIAVSSSADADNALDEYIIPACTWAVFSGTGTGMSIQELEQRIVTEWLPTSGFEYDNAPDIEVYLNPDPNDMQYEVWVPVKPVRKV